jgi:hypothetical protein
MNEQFLDCVEPVLVENPQLVGSMLERRLAKKNLIDPNDGGVDATLFVSHRQVTRSLVLPDQHRS